MNVVPDPTRVLIVDDDDDHRLVLRRLFGRVGITEVFEAADGDGALAAARETRPDVVVLDLAMPGRSGIDVLPELHEAVGPVPIVVLSNLARRRWEADVIARGAVGFVEKSTSTDRVISEVMTVARLLERLGVALERSSAAPGVARRFVRTSLAGIDPEMLDAVELLTSEPVTNAVVHAGSEPRLLLVLLPDRIRVEVHDADSTLPARREPDVASPDGRGLVLLEQLSTSWGVDRTEEGKVVWFEVPRRTTRAG